MWERYMHHIDKKIVRILTEGEKNAIKCIIIASKIHNAEKLIDFVNSAKVEHVNEDGSIVAFCIDNQPYKGHYQNIIIPTGFVEDSMGTAGEVLLFADKSGKLTEFEIVSYGEDDVGIPLWDTFRLNLD